MLLQFYKELKQTKISTDFDIGCVFLFCVFEPRDSNKLIRTEGKPTNDISAVKMYYPLPRYIINCLTTFFSISLPTNKSNFYCRINKSLTQNLSDKVK